MYQPVSLSLDIPRWLQEFVDTAHEVSSDQDKMLLAIELSRRNVEERTGGPFGAVICDALDNRVIGVGVNLVVSNHCSLWHAEVCAILFAQRAEHTYSLRDRGIEAELFSSAEPCAMCLGAVLWSGVNRLVCAASKDQVENIGFSEGPVTQESYRYLNDSGIRTEFGLLREEAAAVLDMYETLGHRIYNP